MFAPDLHETGVSRWSHAVTPVPGTRAVIRDEARALCEIMHRLAQLYLIDADLATAIVYFNLQNSHPVFESVFPI